MLSFLKHVFTWWHGYTLGTKWYTLLNGEKVGEDEQGNIYYRSKKGDRRWVIYNGPVEASRVPAEWHRWLHRTAKQPPSEAPPLIKSWEKPHQENLTGSPQAYAPRGSLDKGGQRAPATGDYEAWRP